MSYRRQKDWHVDTAAEWLKVGIENIYGSNGIEVEIGEGHTQIREVPKPSEGPEYVYIDAQQGYSEGYIRITMMGNNTSAFNIIDAIHRLQFVVDDVWTMSYDKNVVRFKIVPRELSELSS